MDFVKYSDASKQLKKYEIRYLTPGLELAEIVFARAENLET